MSISIEFLQLLLIIMLYIVLFLVAKMLIKKLSSQEEVYVRNNKRLTMILSLMTNSFQGTLESLRELKEIKQTLLMDSSHIRWESDALNRVAKRESLHLKSLSSTRRKAAATYLGLIATEEARLILEKAIRREKNVSVKIYISNALTDIHNPESLPILIDELINSHKWYREKAISNIMEYGELFMPYFYDLKETRAVEHRELIIKFAGENLNHELKAYLLDFVNRYDMHMASSHAHYNALIKQGSRKYKITYLQQDMNGLLEMTCRTLANIYSKDLAIDRYWNSSNSIIKRNAFWAVSKQKTTEFIHVLLAHFHEEEYGKTLIGCTTAMVEANPRFLYVVEEAFEKELDKDVKNRLAQVLSNKIEYYILKLNTKTDAKSTLILQAILENGRINELIGFMNKNRDLDLENRLIDILRTSIDSDNPLQLSFRAYLDPHLLKKWHLEPYQFPKTREDQIKDPNLVLAVVLLTIVAIVFFPIYFIATNYELVMNAPFIVSLKDYVITFNYVLAFYSVSINLSYLVLLGFSYKNLMKQSALWNLKNITMLFRNKMIPTISIVAPAYNEETNIIASANSLLNLKYPDYELIIVNDGSQDNTLNCLIDYYSLLRVDYYYNDSLITEPIRGIYRNPSYPKLIVVDKNNGGKADSLNAGINVANKEYFCGIDADSLLETEALLKLASLTLDESVETPALGGNIFPLNGCEVDHGLISKIRIPDNHLGRFQTIEYIRAFMAGRLGWQEIDSLLIISGAFGLFRKDRIISIGGYMTHRGRYKKDTVGEDMELVVRISRLLHESKQRFKILYAFNANCWTEVPEDLKSLKSQRIRWHRGLIDILFFHKKMQLNPHYGTTGMIGLPYFLIFEAFGPMIEFQGYLMVILAAFLNILDARIALMLFITTILLGVIVSLSSLLIAEHETNYFSTKDLLKLMGYAVIENFGPRQLFSFYRIIGQFKVMTGAQSWGHIKRKGVK